MTPSASNCARSATQTRSGGLTSEGMRFAAKAMAEKPANSSRQELHSSRCARASRDSGLVKSSPNTASKSSHCILGLRTEEPWGGPCLEYNQSFDACCGPRRCFHSSLFLRTRLCFCGLTFLASLFAHFFLKQLAQTGPRLVQLRFRISNGASHNLGNLVVLVPLDVVKDENGPIARRQFLDGALKIDPIDGAGKAQVRSTHIALGPTAFGIRLQGLFQRIGRQGLFPQPHEHDVNRHAMEPSRKCRFAAKRADFPEKLEESLLG